MTGSPSFVCISRLLSWGRRDTWNLLHQPSSRAPLLYVVSADSHLRFSLCFPTLCFSWRVNGVLLAPQTLYACALIWRRTDFSEAFLLSEDHSHCAPFLSAVTHPRAESSTRTENRDFEKITLTHCFNGESCTKTKFGSE